MAASSGVTEIGAGASAESMWLLRRDSLNDEALAASYGGHALLLGLGVRYQPGYQRLK